MSGYSGRSFRFFRPAAVPGIDNALILFDLKCHLKKETYLSKKKKAAIKERKKKGLFRAVPLKRANHEYYYERQKVNQFFFPNKLNKNNFTHELRC